MTLEKIQFTLHWNIILYLYRWEKRMRVQKKRFTLVEILMVTGMICLIAALIIVAYNGVYRCWSSKNTIATMKAAHMALDRYMLENGSYPTETSKKTLEEVSKKSVKLAKELLQDCAPYSKTDGSNTKVFDDFGKESDIYYVYPAKKSTSFALLSAGKDGIWNTNDDIIYLPAGTDTLKPGFYIGKTTDDGSVSDTEPLAQ